MCSRAQVSLDEIRVVYLHRENVYNRVEVCIIFTLPVKSIET